MVRRIDKRLTRDFDYGDSGADDLGYGAPAPAPVSVAPAPAAAPTDPYSTIRNVMFTQMPGYTVDTGYYENSGETMGTMDLPAYWSPDFGDLKSLGLQSKYNATEEITSQLGPETREKLGGQQVFKSTFQRPGMHKYDTMDAYYVMDPATGQARMVGEPTPTRQISGGEWARDAFEEATKTLAPFALSLMAPGIGAAMGAGTGVAGAAVGGATVGAANAALQGKTGSDILKGALIGGVGGAGGSYLSGLDAASSLGITDPTVGNVFNQAVKGGGSAALQTGLRGGDLSDVASSFGTGALTSGIGAAAGEGLQALLPEGTDLNKIQRGVDFAGKLYNVAQNPTAGGIMSLAQTGAGFLSGRGSATDVLGDKYPELGDRQAPPVYENIDNSEFRPISPFELPEIPEMAQLNGVEPSISPWEDRGPGEGGYDFSDFTPAPSPAPSQADMEYFLSTNIPNEPKTVQDLMAQYYPEPSQAPAFEPVNPFADLPPEEPMQRVEITAPRTGVYDYDVGTGDMRFPDLFDSRIDENGYGDLIPPPAAVAPPVSIKPPAPSIKIPGVGGTPSPAPAPKAKSDTDMAGLFALLGSMGGQQGQAAENYQVANVENPIMRGLVNDLLGRSYT